MKITTIEVSIGLTANTGDYNNVRPEVRLQAELDENDNPNAVYITLMNEARQKVQDEVDAELMRLGQSPRYYTGPLYSVMTIGNANAIVVYSNDCMVSPMQIPHSRRVLNNFPLGQCVAKAHEYRAKHQFEIFVVETQAQFNDLLASFKQAEEEKEITAPPADLPF